MTRGCTTASCVSLSSRGTAQEGTPGQSKGKERRRGRAASPVPLHGARGPGLATSALPRACWFQWSQRPGAQRSESSGDQSLLVYVHRVLINTPEL